jgi:hypothetical protein
LFNAGNANCAVKNTILFVAFDFEEETDECTVSTYRSLFCGSNRFVKNITSYLKKTGGTINGAIILETMLNHNSLSGICCSAVIILHEILISPIYNKVYNKEYTKCNVIVALIYYINI